MAVKVVSDLHGATDALKREVGADDTLLLLGDLVNIIDYTAMDGILIEIFGVEAVQHVIDLRGEGKVEEAREVMARRRAGREAEVGERFISLIREEYVRVIDVMPPETYLILGNVDWPPMADELVSAGAVKADGAVELIDGMKVGFVGGGLPTPLKVAGEISEEEYNAKVDGLGEVDVLCSHMPPDIPELTFDTLANRHERGSVRLLEYIRDVQPAKVLFGHIHQPFMSSMHIGRSHLLNVGYFRRTERAYTLSL
jgi:Icc-related predicted phosphoesterase